MENKEVITVQMDKEFYESVGLNATGGGSGGGESGGDEWHYYSLSEPMPAIFPKTMGESILFTLAKMRNKESGTKRVSGLFLDKSELYEMIGFAANFSTMVSDLSQYEDLTKTITIGELMQKYGGYDSVLGEGFYTEITEAEFYSLD